MLPAVDEMDCQIFDIPLEFFLFVLFHFGEVKLILELLN